MGTAKEDARKILNHLLSKLKEPDSRHYERYGGWIEKHPGLEDFALTRLRSEVIQYLDRGARSIEA